MLVSWPGYIFLLVGACEILASRLASLSSHTLPASTGCQGVVVYRRQTPLQHCAIRAQTNACYARCTNPHFICMPPTPLLLQSLELPLKRGGIKNSEYFYSQKEMKLPTEQHAEHSEIETEKQSRRRSACMMKLSNTSYTTNTLKLPQSKTKE